MNPAIPSVTRLLVLTLALIFIAAPATYSAPEAPLPKGKPAALGFDPGRLGRLHEMVQNFVSNRRHAGIVLLIARHGKIVDWNAYGFRDLENRLPMEKDTICRIYSMSKIIASVAVLQLWEEGRFNLDDPIELYLPELKAPWVLTGGTAEVPELVRAKRPIAIKHLLTHTSGMIYDFSAGEGYEALTQLYQRAKLWESPDLKSFITKVARLPLKHHPGDAFTYGINTDVLGALVESVSGMSFQQFLQSRLFGPLKMLDTDFDVPASKRHRLAKTYRHGPDKNLVEADHMLGASAEPGEGIFSGGAGLFSTAGDYARFAQMLLNKGELEGVRILGRKSVELMTANHLELFPDQSHALNKAHGFGLGVEVQLGLGRGTVPGSPGAYGWYGAATTYVRIDPVEDLLAIALTQHFPYNEHGFFSKFATLYYQALVGP